MYNKASYYDVSDNLQVLIILYTSQIKIFNSLIFSQKLHKMFFSSKMDDGILLPIIYAISFLLNKIVLAILYKNVKVLYVYIRKALQKQRRLWYIETCINRCLLECTISRNKNLLNEFELKRYTWHLLILPFGDVNTFDVYWYIY